MCRTSCHVIKVLLMCCASQGRGVAYTELPKAAQVADVVHALREVRLRIWLLGFTSVATSITQSTLSAQHAYTPATTTGFLVHW